MAEKSLSLRLAQTIAPFGVGAIYSINRQSFVAMDINEWTDISDPIVLERLSRKLGVSEFRSPKTIPESDEKDRSDHGAPYFRFPRWLFCQVCRQLKWFPTEDEKEGYVPECTACKKNYTPMRFIAICEDGHMQDVEWHNWVHDPDDSDYSKSQCQERENLIFDLQENAGSSLAANFIECKVCKSRRSLEGIRSNLGHEGRGQGCYGKQPWQRSVPNCCKPLRAVHHGAGNVHFALTPLAIDIPPASDHDSYRELYRLVTNHENFKRLTSSVVREINARVIALACNTDAATVLKIYREYHSKSGEKVVDLTSQSEPAAMPDDSDILFEEWQAFLSSRTNYSDLDNFNVASVDIGDLSSGNAADQQLSLLLDRVVKGQRLRIVKTLQGFTRHTFDREKPTVIRPDLTTEGQRDIDWLPAVEIFGEGIFISFKEDLVRAWENKPEVQARVQRVNGILEGTSFGTIPSFTDARTIMLHTLSHIIIRRAGFSAGYSLSSIAERGYASSSERPMAGMLFYTAAGDTEGSLGGLVKLADPSQLFRIIKSSLIDAMWCSQDPICTETTSGHESVNQAACHACCFLPETSCENSNILLDRSLVVGPMGFLKQVNDYALGDV